MIIFFKRLLRLLRHPGFRRHPVSSVVRRIRWTLFWRRNPTGSFDVPFFGGMTIGLAHTSASAGIYLNNGFSDPAIANLFLRLAGPGMVAFDCGAHIGEYTLLLGSLVGPSGQVHAFEPDPRVFRYLETNVSRNRLKNARLNALAVDARTGRERYSLASDATESLLARFDRKPDANSVDVQTITLDEYAAECGIERLDIVKLDVEGAELGALTGGHSMIARHRPSLIFVECHSVEAARDLQHMLCSLGYEVELDPPGQHLFPHIVARSATAR